MGMGTLAHAAMKRELNPTRSMENLPTEGITGNEARATLMGSMGGKRTTIMKVTVIYFKIVPSSLVFFLC